MRAATNNVFAIGVLRRFQTTQPMRAATSDIGFVIYPKRFQTTQPMRAATAFYVADGHSLFISNHAAHEGCDIFHFGKFLHVRKISNHAAHEGCDRCAVQSRSTVVIFQTTQPMRAATRRCSNSAVQVGFHTTQPMRAATLKNSTRILPLRFQTTQPMRAATAVWRRCTD